jgi:PAS domain S-box-containing protein/putative nucleotidyltransferase with HDIG domain
MASLQAPPDLHLLTQTLASCSVGVVISDARQPDFPILYVNPAFEQLSGYPAQEILGRNCRFLQGSDRDQAGAEEIRQAMALQKNVTVTLRNYRQDGSLFYNELTLSPIFDASGILTHYAGFQKDVTEREQARQEQAQLQRTLSSTLERVTDGVVSFDLDWNIRYVNPAAAAIVNRQPGELRGQNFLELFSLDVHSPIGQALQRAGATGLVQRELSYSVALERWLEATAYPTENGASLFVRDVTRQHHAQAQQQASEERFSKVFEAAPIGIVVTRISDERYLDANPDFLQQSGYSREEVVGQRSRDLNIWADQTQREDAWHIIRQQGELRNYRLRFRLKSGSVADAVVSIVPVMIGDEACVVTSIRNTTAENRAYQQLQESEQYARRVATELQRTLDMSLDFIATSDVNGRFVSVNAASEPILGYTPTEMIGRAYLDFVHPDDHLLSTTEVTTLVPGVPTVMFQNRYLHKDGHVVWMEWNTLQMPGDTLLYSVGRDVTQRRAAAEDQSFLAAIVRASYNAIVGVNLDGTIRSWNAGAERLYGYTASEAIGQPMTITTPEGLQAEATQAFQRVRQGELVEPFESVRITRDGRELFVVMTVSAVLNTAGQVIGVAKITRDITARHAAELKVQALNQDLQRQVDYVTSLRDIDQSIAASADLGFTLGLILDTVRRQLGVDAATALLLNLDTLNLENTVTRGFSATVLQGTDVDLTAGMARQVALNRQPLDVPDLGSFLALPTWRDALLQEGLTAYYAVPLIAKGQVVGVMEVLNRQALGLSPLWLEMLETLVGLAAIAVENAQLLQELERSNLELRLAYDETIEGWARALDLRDHETEGHSRRVTEQTVALCQQLGLPPEDLVHVRRGALLHDIGKMGVRDAVLLKPGALTDEEWAEMRKHPGYAVALLRPIRFLLPALDIPEYHHEKWDGSGYPLGLKGTEIPVAARAFALVDVYDALTSHRPYRRAWTRERTLEHLRSEAGSHFDPDLVQIFIQMIQS